MQKYYSKNILVTGGRGFIGSHLVEKLVKQKLNVVIIDRLNLSRSYFNLKNLSSQTKVIFNDIKDYGKVLKVLRKYKIDYIFHLAAQSLVEKAFLNPLDTFKDNILGTANILEAARSYGQIKGIVTASSDKAYGKTKRKYKETDALCGDHPYEVSKTCADLIGQTYFKTYKLPIVITRFGNVFGPGDINFNRIIPGIMESIIKKKVLLVRSNGKYVRDYIYIKDAVDGYLLLLKNIDKVKGEAFNFGSQNTFSVLNLINQIEKILKVKVRYKILNQEKNEIPYQSLNWQKAEKILNWQPQFDFAKGVLQTYRWYKNYFKNEKTY